MGGGAGEDGFAVQRVVDEATADREVEVVVGAVAGARGLQVEDLLGGDSSHGSGEESGSEELHFR